MEINTSSSLKASFDDLTSVFPGSSQGGASAISTPNFNGATHSSHSHTENYAINFDPNNTQSTNSSFESLQATHPGDYYGHDDRKSSRRKTKFSDYPISNEEPGLQQGVGNKYDEAPFFDKCRYVREHGPTEKDNKAKVRHGENEKGVHRESRHSDQSLSSDRSASDSHRRYVQQRSRCKSRYSRSRSRSLSRSVSISRSRSRSRSCSSSGSRSRSGRRSRSTSRSRIRSRSRSWQRYRSRSRSVSSSRSPRHYYHRSSRRSRSRSRSRDRYYRDRTRQSSRFGKEVPSSTLVLKGIVSTVTEDDLRAILREWEPLTSVRIMRDRQTGVSRGFAFVDFPSVDVAQTVKNQFFHRGGLVIEGRSVLIEYSKSASSLPSGNSGFGFGMRGSDWLCKECDATNFARRMKCYKCQASRPEDAVLLDLNSSSSYFVNKGYEPTFSGEQSHVLMIRGIDDSITEDTLHYEFSKHAPIRELRIIRDKITQLSRGFAFVQFNSVEDARKALDATNGIQLDHYGPRIKVSFARNASSSPYQDLDYFASSRFDEIGWAPREYTEVNYTTDTASNVHNASLGSYASEAAAWSTAYGGAQSKLGFNLSNNNFDDNIHNDPNLGFSQINVSRESNHGDKNTPLEANESSAGGFVWDPSSGYYYNASSGLYYDGYREIYYDTKSGHWLKYDAEKKEYSIYSSSDNQPASNVASHANSFSQVGGGVPKIPDSILSAPFDPSTQHESAPDPPNQSIASSASYVSHVSSAIAKDSISGTRIPRGNLAVANFSQGNSIGAPENQQSDILPSAKEGSGGDISEKKSSLAELMAAAASAALKAEKEKEKLREKDKEAKRKVQEQLNAWKQRQQEPPKSAAGKTADGFKTANGGIKANKHWDPHSRTFADRSDNTLGSKAPPEVQVHHRLNLMESSSNVQKVSSYQTSVSDLRGKVSSNPTSGRRRFSEKPSTQQHQQVKGGNNIQSSNVESSLSYRDRAAERRSFYQNVVAKGTGVGSGD